MNSWKNYIWKVPLYCFISGIIDFHLSVKMLSWTLIRLPAGSVTSDNTKAIIVYGIIFMVSLLIGGFVFFRKMTKRELFYSTSVLVIYGILLALVQKMFHITSGFAVMWMLYLWRPFEMFTFILQLLLNLGINTWVVIFVEIFTPYLFILFGKKQIQS
jgi:membrane-associated HD superfamily phosphohydrolase